MKKKPIRTALLILLAIFFAIVLVDSMGAFDNRPYYEVPHGNHTHYMPREDCDPKLSPSNAPTVEPGPGETVNCQGQIVALNP